jgi:GTP-binding protein
MTEEIEIPKRRAVVIIGRPNVGKSAIFNRLAGERIAIVHEQSGVTRDRLMREVVWANERFDLVDTGGLCNIDRARTRDEIEAGIRMQAGAALADASAAILVTDLQAGIHPLDQEVARLVKESGCFAVVAANKADNEDRDAAAADFHGLGFTVFPVSALHDRGFEPLMNAVLAALPPGRNPTVENPLRVAVVGRPNVGKSSYINRLLRSDRLIVSSVPGTTRDSIDVPFAIGTGMSARHYVLIDTAGLRQAGKVDSLVEKFSQVRAENSVERSDIALLVIDGSDTPKMQDKKIAGLIEEHARGCVVVISKWDLATMTERAYEKELRWHMPFMNHCPLVFLSAKTGYNIRGSIDAVDHVASQVRVSLPTGILNRTILDAYEKVQPPSVNGKRLKIYYCTQVGTSPIRVRMFVNDPRIIVDAYREYLIKTLRRRFGLDGAPIILQFSARNTPESRVRAGRSKRR